MKVLLVNGSPHAEGCTATALHECERTFAEDGIATEWFWIGTKPVRGCIACMQCRSNNGHCIFDDDPANELIGKLEEADGVIIGSPVYYAGMNGVLKSLLDRAFYAGFANVAHKPGAGIASARRAGTTLTIDQINKYFQICQMPVVGSSYWPMVHGNTSEEAQQDVEGLQTMRVLARNMAYLLKCKEAALAAGIEPPIPEPKMKFSFIR